MRKDVLELCWDYIKKGRLSPGIFGLPRKGLGPSVRSGLLGLTRAYSGLLGLTRAYSGLLGHRIGHQSDNRSGCSLSQTEVAIAVIVDTDALLLSILFEF
jgi:hypothetical protein